MAGSTIRFSSARKCKEPKKSVSALGSIIKGLLTTAGYVLKVSIPFLPRNSHMDSQKLEVRSPIKKHSSIRQDEV